MNTSRDGQKHKPAKQKPQSLTISQEIQLQLHFPVLCQVSNNKSHIPGPNYIAALMLPLPLYYIQNPNLKGNSVPIILYYIMSFYELESYSPLWS